jgi:hypothetical protein
MSTIHPLRTVKIGRALQQRPDHLHFDGFMDFLNWAGRVVGRSGFAVKYSLQTLGLWRPGTRGSAGGDDFQAMLEEIVRFSEAHGGEAKP